MNQQQQALYWIPGLPPRAWSLQVVLLAGLLLAAASRACPAHCVFAACSPADHPHGLPGIAATPTHGVTSRAQAAAKPAPPAQVFYLDLDGAADVIYRGPIRVTGISVPAFQAPDNLAGQEARIVAAVLARLGDEFRHHGVHFTVAVPASRIRPSLSVATTSLSASMAAFSGWQRRTMPATRIAATTPSSSVPTSIMTA